MTVALGIIGVACTLLTVAHAVGLTHAAVGSLRTIWRHHCHHMALREDIRTYGGGVVIKCGFCRREFGSPA